MVGIGCREGRPGLPCPIAVIAKAGKANYADTARIGFNVIVGIIIAALGAWAISYAVFGKSLLSFFGFEVS